MVSLYFLKLRIKPFLITACSQELVSKEAIHETTVPGKYVYVQEDTCTVMAVRWHV